MVIQSIVNSQLLLENDSSYTLTLSWRRPLSYRNQSIDLQSKSMDWFLYDNGLYHERVKMNTWGIWIYQPMHLWASYFRTAVRFLELPKKFFKFLSRYLPCIPLNRKMIRKKQPSSIIHTFYVSCYLFEVNVQLLFLCKP